MRKYEPNDWMRDRMKNDKNWPCKGLAGLVGDARAEGWTVAVDLGPDNCGEDDDLEEVTRATAVAAVNEVDEALMYFFKEGEKTQLMQIIPCNGTDWCVDYTIGAGDFLDRLWHKHVYD